MTPFYLLLGAASFYVVFLMTILWAVAVFKNNTSIVDIGWGLSFSLIAILGLILGEGAFLKKLILSLMILAWSLRLTWHLWQRFDFSTDDPRYLKILAQMGENHRSFKMYLQFLFQAFLILVLSLPFYLVFGYSGSQWSFWEGLALFIFSLGLFGEARADWQLSHFKSDAKNKGKVCQEGLWKYSRHPNYFFEWVIWISFFFFAVSGPFGFWAIISPLIMFVLLTKVSGIPPAEAQSLNSKGDAYRKYIATTSAFFPWFPK